MDADLIIFVSLDDTGFYSANKIEAAAVHCLQDDLTNRPIAGFINFRPDLDLKNSTSLDYMVWLALHEMTHILVFNDALYEDFVDENLNSLNLTNILGSKILDNQKKMNFLKSKNVLEKGKKHYNCSNLEGVPLEFMGGSGTVGSHWSKRIMNTDYMIGDSYGENLISDITLALFEDSGWYKVDYNMSNLFLWGKNKGCNFLDLNKKCIRIKNASENYHILKNKHKNKTILGKNIKNSAFLKNNTKNIQEKNLTELNSSQINNKNTQNIISNKTKFSLNNYETDFSPEFCTKLNYPVCSTSHIFRGNCRVKRFKSALSSFESYFSDSFVGGTNNLANKCPIPTEEKIFNIYYSGSCRKGTPGKSQLKIEKICPECSCFMSNLVEIKNDIQKRNYNLKNYENQKKILSDDIDNESNENDDIKNNDNRMTTESENSNDMLQKLNKDLVPQLNEEDNKAMCFEFK